MLRPQHCHPCDQLDQHPGWSRSTSCGSPTRRAGNVLAGTDCRFSQGPFSAKVRPSVQWAKLKALVDRAELATGAVAVTLRCGKAQQVLRIEDRGLRVATRILIR